jgi:hypothetical protein
MAVLFELDHAGEVERVERLDLRPIATAAQEAAERLDDRALLMVTGWLLLQVPSLASLRVDREARPQTWSDQQGLAELI